MDVDRHPQVLDQLAAAHALGLLRGGARRRFEALARERAPVRAAALIWQSRLDGLTELQPAADVPEAVWIRIANVLRAEREQRALTAARAAPSPRGGWLRSLNLWRGAAGAGVLAAVLALVAGLNLREQLGGQIDALQARLQSQAQVGYVAVLNDAQARPSMLVTFDPQSQRLTLQRVGDYREAADRSLQLWALPAGGAPRSLGVLAHQPQQQLSAADAELRAVPALAISLEPLGGVPSAGGPTGPVLFTGALIRKTL